MRTQMASELRTLLDADVEAVRILFRAHQALALIAAHDPEIRSLALDLAASKDVGPEALLRSARLGELHAELGPWIERDEYDGFAVFNPDGIIVAASRATLLGKRYAGDDGEFIATVLAGRATVSRPFPSTVMLTDLDGRERVGVPTMFVAAPIRGDDGRVVAALGFRMRPERTFTRILNVARLGTSGETYAFDRSGRLLSQSRFDDDLKRIGLIADQPHVRSILNLELRDPGVDMTTGGRPAQRRGEQPLTRMAAEAVEGRAGVDVAGYRDYRGVPVVGAWTWLPEYGFGVATEIDRAEAYRPLAILRTAFWAPVRRAGRRRRRRLHPHARHRPPAASGPPGGPGGRSSSASTRSRRRSAPAAWASSTRPATPCSAGRRPSSCWTWRRPTDAAIARFEREVQLTSQLNHPNTIAIYDYGRTPEGVFYYAMEYLDGIDLDDLVERYGPQPEGRVIHILQQVCGSLAEAHAVGLVHRDIKPANIMLNRRGGDRRRRQGARLRPGQGRRLGREASLTAAGSITGTPLYLSPEAIERPDEVDARSDLYAVGAVGYFLLTGTPPFRGGGLAEVLWKQVREVPEPPSARLGAEVSEDLEALDPQVPVQATGGPPRGRTRPHRGLVAVPVGGDVDCRGCGVVVAGECAPGGREDPGAGRGDSRRRGRRGDRHHRLGPAQ